MNTMARQSFTSCLEGRIVSGACQDCARFRESILWVCWQGDDRLGHNKCMKVWVVGSSSAMTSCLSVRIVRSNMQVFCISC